MFCFKEVKEWHNKCHTQIPTENVDSNFDRSYVKTKLENGLLRVWRVCMLRLSTITRLDWLS